MNGTCALLERQWMLGHPTYLLGFKAMQGHLPERFQPRFSVSHRPFDFASSQRWYIAGHTGVVWLDHLTCIYRWVTLKFCMWKLPRFKLLPPWHELEGACCCICAVSYTWPGWELSSALSADPNPSSGFLAEMSGTFESGVYMKISKWLAVWRTWL